MFWLLFLISFALFMKFVDADFYTFIASLLPFTKDKMKAKYNGKVVWVVGASAGIGEELAVQLASLGAILVLSARREDELKRVAQRCQSVGPPSSPPPTVLPFDLRDVASHSDRFNSVLRLHNRVDVVLLNSGVSQRSPAVETKFEVTRDLTELNALSFVSLTKCVLPHFTERKSGQFIVTSSVAGKVSTALSSTYNLTKFGINGYFDGLRCEVGKEVEVVICCPGPIGTDIVKNAIAADGNPLGSKAAESKEKKMATPRCAFLMLVAGTYNIYEAWISQNPVLLITYLNQYFPTVTRFLMVWVIGPGRLRAQKEGGDTYSIKTILFGTKKKAE